MSEDTSKEYESLLEKRNQDLLDELNRLKSKPRGKIAYILIAAGSIFFAISLDYSQSLAAFLSLALIFWGILFLYVKPTDFIRQDLLFSVLKETSQYYSQILNSLSYEGTPYYYSPKTLSDFSNVYMFIPKDKSLSIGYDMDDSGYLKLNPFGLELSNLIEEESKLNFAKSDLKDIFLTIGKILVENLEIVKKFEFNIEDNIIRIKVTESILNNDDINKMDYLSNAIACAIAKSTHNPVVIRDVKYEPNEGIKLTEYEIIDQVVK